MTDTDTGPVVVRFAPSPTGFLHIGGARTALMVWALWKQRGGRNILRIEDTDRLRFVPEAQAQIVSSLRALGLDWTEGPDIGGPHAPYVQTERAKLGIYDEHARKLIASGHAYKCWCEKSRVDELRADQVDEGEQPGYDGHCRRLSDAEKAKLEASGAPYVVRMACPHSGSTIVYDEVRGKIPFRNMTLVDTILVKTDRLPTYHLAAVVDDHLMGVTHVIRGIEWLSSAPLHFLLYSFFGWTPPKFVHVAEVQRPDGKKYSKRDNDSAVNEWLDNLGYLPEGLLNGLILTGFSTADNTEVMNPYTELPSRFDLKRIIKASAQFHLSKAEHLNRQHIRRLSPTALAHRLLPYLVRAGLIDNAAKVPVEELMTPERLALLEKLAPLLQKRIPLLTKAAEMVQGFFVTPAPSRADLVGAGTVEIADGRLAATVDALTALERFDGETVTARLMSLAESDGGPKEFFPVLYLAITGSSRSLPVSDTIVILGRTESLARLDRARATLA